MLVVVNLSMKSVEDAVENLLPWVENLQTPEKNYAAFSTSQRIVRRLLHEVDLQRPIHLEAEKTIQRNPTIHMIKIYRLLLCFVYAERKITRKAFLEK